MKKIVFVNQGGWGRTKCSRGDYNNLIKLLCEAIEKMSNADGGKVATTKVVDNIDEALIKAEEIDSLIFVSRSMISEARKVKKSYPWIDIIVLTGLIPEDEVILVSKAWIGSKQSIQDILVDVR